MAETLLIDGTDIDPFVESISFTRGLVGLPPMRGGDFEVPHRDGALPGSRWAGPRVVSVGGLLYGRNGAVLVPGDARARYLDSIRGLSALVYNDGKDTTYTRVIPRASGGDLTVEAEGRYLAGLDSIEQAAFHAGRFVFDLYLFDPFWYATSATAISAFGPTATPTVGGDVATKRVSLTFSGATGQRLTNNTTGEWVEIVGNAGTPTVVDCEAFTATRSGISKAGEVSHNPAFDRWFSLAAGSNSLTLSGGGLVSISYTAAYA